jgi:opacity protein-like surface antigen
VKEQEMKQIFKHSLLAVLLIALAASTCFADENGIVQNSNEAIQLKVPYRAKGFHANLSLGAVVTFYNCKDSSECLNIFPVLPGKIDLTLGYQINPYVSIDTRLWTFWMLVFGAELSPKVHLIHGRFSPFVIGTVGIVSLFGSRAATYIGAGGGIDLYIKKSFSIFAMARYLSATFESDKGAIVVPEFGIQYNF